MLAQPADKTVIPTGAALTRWSSVSDCVCRVEAMPVSAAMLAEPAEAVARRPREVGGLPGGVAVHAPTRPPRRHAVGSCVP